jgi:hypothetical protein
MVMSRKNGRRATFSTALPKNFDGGQFSKRKKQQLILAETF